MEKLPQRLVNVRVRDRDALEGADDGLGGGRARVGSRSRARPRAGAPIGDRAARPGDGRGPARGRVRGDRGTQALANLSRHRAEADATLRMCGIIGYVGSRECRDLLLQGLQRLEYRGYDSAGLSLVTNGVDRQRPRRRQPSEPARRRAPQLERPPEGLHRHRPHALGHARPRDRGERPPALGHLRARPHRPERHRRELDRAARPADGRGRRVHLRDRRRGRGPPDRRPLRRRPGRGRAARLQRPARPLRVRRDVRRRARACWSAPARSARWWSASATARASSPPRSPPSCPRRATSSSSTTARSWRSRREGSRFIDADGDRDRARGRPRSTGTTRQAEKGGYETFMLKEIHEQADAVAETIADRRARRRGRPRGHRRSPTTTSAASARIVIVACGTSYHAGLVGRYAIEWWARVPGGDGHRLRVPLPQPGARRARPRDRHLPVGRDRRHAGRDAARARARRQGARRSRT